MRTRDKRSPSDGQPQGRGFFSVNLSLSGPEQVEHMAYALEAYHHSLVDVIRANNDDPEYQQETGFMASKVVELMAGLCVDLARQCQAERDGSPALPGSATPPAQSPDLPTPQDQQ